MKLIVGLGNPGVKFENTRHNVGFVVLDKLAQMVNGQWSMDKKFNSLTINHQQLTILSKPQTFMNSSGEAVKSLSTFYHILTPNIWVIHDDLDIKIGSYKIQNKGPKIHNGLLSIYEKTGIKDFWHVRVGVDNRIAEERIKISGERYVLEEFTGEEKFILDKVVGKVTEELLQIVAGRK